MTDNTPKRAVKFHWFTWIFLPVFIGVLVGTSLWQYVQLRDIRAALDKADTAPRERVSQSESEWAPVQDSMTKVSHDSLTKLSQDTPQRVILSEERFTALATGYVQGFEHNRAQDLEVQKMTLTDKTDPVLPYLVVKYRRVSEAHPEGENVTGFVVWGIETDGTLTVKHYACTPCGA